MPLGSGSPRERGLPPVSLLSWLIRNLTPPTGTATVSSERQQLRGEATRRIKSHPLLKQTVVIAVTGHGFPADVERAMRAGCHAVVVKPCDVMALGQQVRLLVSERERRVPARASRPRGRVTDAQQG